MNETVLIVDDSLTVRMDLAEAFCEDGFETLVCGTAAEARERLAEGLASIYILDVLLPDGDGVELLQDIRRSPLGSSAVVVMLSTEAEISDRIRGLQTGADEYVGKPYNTDYLTAKVRELAQARHRSLTAGQTVLLVAGDTRLGEYLRAECEGHGFTLLTAPTGEEGLRVAGALRPDAVMIEAVLPGIDGATVIRHLRLDAALRDIPCLLLTGSDDRGAELRALDAGADTMVRKDDDCAVILAKLGSVVRRTTNRGTHDDATRSLMGLKKILAIGDSAAELQRLADGLAGEGYDLILARSGTEAFELLAVQPVDCMLLASARGLDTCARLKASPVVRDIPLMVLSDRDDRQSMIDSLAAGADDYLPTSDDLDVLKARVRAQIRRKQFEDERRRVRDEMLSRELEAAEARAARELAEARAKLVEELERANRDLEAFSYSVSHDLRAPLGAVRGFSHLLRADFATVLPEDGLKLLDHVIAGADRMEHLIEDLLLFSQTGRQPLQREVVDIGALVQETLDELHQQQPDRHIDLRIGALPEALADPSLLKQVFVNLLSNAFKFTRRTDPAIIEIGGERRASECEYFVRDNGAGFDMRFADRLFGVFQRLHEARHFEGTGVGLSIVHQIVQRHGGRIWADSAVNQGATFRFTLPRESGRA